MQYSYKYIQSILVQTSELISAKLERALELNNGHCIIGIDGPTASGKSILAKQLKDILALKHKMPFQFHQEANLFEEVAVLFQNHQILFFLLLL